MRDLEKYDRYVESCFKEEPVPCRCACPFKLDVQAFLGKIRRRNFDSAYREYRSAAIFPGIVSRICPAPCADVCARGPGDGPVRLDAIERACLRFSSSHEPVRYSLPQKDRHVAVVGAGLSGLACALRVASRGYRVTVCEARESTGGELADMLPEDLYRGELDAAFKPARVDFLMGRRVGPADLEALGADAVYIATGKGGDDFGLSGGMDRDSLGSARPGAFLGGGLIGSPGVYAIEHGARAARSIEKYLQIGAMDGMPDSFAAWPINGGYYRPLRPAPAAGCDTPDGAAAEAGRCVGCECAECIDACPMLQEARRTPKRIATDVTATLNKVEQQTRRVATRLMNACSLCGLCGRLCPKGADIGGCLLAGRRDLYMDGGLPPAFHDFYLRDMESALSEAAFAMGPGGPVAGWKPGGAAPAGAECRRLFFPGCQLGASLPEYVTLSYGALLRAEPSTGLLAACCGVPADWAGMEGRRDAVMGAIRGAWDAMGRPLVVFGCMTCMRLFAERLPEIEGRSLYECLDEAEAAAGAAAGALSGTRGEGGTVCVYDPCSARSDEAARTAVRSLLARRGFRLRELRLHGEKASCCGVGGHIYPSNPELFGRIVRERVHEAEEPYVAYCSNCRDAFSREGKACSHILDELFSLQGRLRPAPLLAQRRANRLALRSMLAARFGGDGQGAPAWDAGLPELEIPPALQEKMERLLISGTEAREAVAWCEGGGSKLFDPEAGHFIGHRRVGAATCWVVYEPAAGGGAGRGGFRLVNIYSHRLQLREGDEA
ncbi:MAG: NAD(P)-binding protein [Clostridiales Family XIII bacterium]|nr:NAD(P)-binding protein [Clostridiales Family XIII bacterium]